MRATYRMVHSIRTTLGCQFFLLSFGILDGFPTAHLRNLGPTSLLNFRTRNYFIHRAVSSKSDSTNAPGCELRVKVLPARILLQHYLRRNPGSTAIKTLLSRYD